MWRLHDLHDHAIVNATPANVSTSLLKALTSLEYHLSLGHALMEPLLATRFGPGSTPSSQETRLMGKHFPYSEFRRQCVVRAYKKTTARESKLRGTKLRRGVPRLSSNYAWGSGLSYTIPDFITETTRLQAGSNWNHKFMEPFRNHTYRNLLATVNYLIN